MMEQTRIHPETGRQLRRDVRPMTISYAAYSRTLPVPGWYPEDAGDAVHDGDDLTDVDAAIASMRAEYATDLRRLRRSLKLSQQDAGRIFGGGKRAFQKYEAGAMAPSEAAVGLIELVRHDPSMIEVLKRLPGRAIHTAP
ncbi:type II TA system antitoxin MqsA family protein [Sphingomonas sp.]|uniref:type II TA system antitoxin MqsA family protein n=1 Tax=Sphingomonas sp. TaxID=28214 RepID=UPI003AFFE2E0